MMCLPLHEGSIWRQARGSAVEILGSKAVAISSEKVGIAQQWFDELDYLAFSNTEESTNEEKESHDDNFEDCKGMNIDRAVNVSPGTSEVIESSKNAGWMNECNFMTTVWCFPRWLSMPFSTSSWMTIAVSREVLDMQKQYWISSRGKEPGGKTKHVLIYH